jgi:hypothetical protein
MLEYLQFSKDMQNISSLLKSERKHYMCWYSATTKVLVWKDQMFKIILNLSVINL